MSNNQSTFAFIFDSGRIENAFYGEVIFEYMIKGGELSKNIEEVMIFLGDVLTDQGNIDIEPYVIKDEYCTLDFNKMFQDNPFCWVVENLSSEIACTIDKRLKENLTGYIGTYRVDKTNTSKRKQFWKYTIKKFALHGNVITVFQDVQNEGKFVHSQIATQLGYTIQYEAYYEDNTGIIEKNTNMSQKDNGKTIDIDRDLLTLNFSIREEFQISGALLWKSINALNKIDFSENGGRCIHLIEYPFFTLYFASQGIERMQKIIVELVCKKNHIREMEKEKVYELLMSHAHNKLNNWIEVKEDIKLNKNCRKLIDILTRFYNTVRYARYSDESYMKSNSPEYDLLLELKSSNSLDLNWDIKNRFGNYLGKIANIYYVVYKELCLHLNIYAYELDYDSSACFVFGYRDNPKNLYKEFINRQNAKKEIFYWLMKNASEYPKYSIAKERALDFDAESVEHYLWEIIFNSEDGQEYYDEVEYFYDELCATDKDEWKNRIQLIDYIFDNSK